MTKDDKQAFEVPDRLFEYIGAVVDNRVLATVLFFLLSLLLIGIDNIAGILAVLLIGFLLIDRFEIVRRCVVIGGAAWAMTLAIGAMVLGGIEGPALFDAGFVFNMLGFVLALDPVSTLVVEQLACELKETCTLVVVTHNMQQAARISDSVAFFLLGELVEHAPTAQLFKNPTDPRTADYLTGRFG